MVRLVDGDLLARLMVLRKHGRLKNTTRVLVPLRKNHLLRDALQACAKQWPKAPIKIGWPKPGTCVDREDAACRT